MYYPVYPEATMGERSDYVMVGLFRNRPDVEEALQALDELGYVPDDISVAMTDESRSRNFSISEGTMAAESAAGGGLIGGLAGALIGGLLGAGVIASGGLALVTAGPLLGTLAGFGAGSALGGVLGALAGLGVPEHEIELFHSHLKSGNFLLAVRAAGPESADAVRTIFESAGAINMDGQRAISTAEEEKAAQPGGRI